MPYLVIWSPQAVAGIQRAYRFLAGKDLGAAQSAAKAILRQAEILEAFPNAGRPAEDLEPEHRELLVPFGSSGYVILYHVGEPALQLTVLAVRHQREVGP